jgi:hypothetical protein
MIAVGTKVIGDWGAGIPLSYGTIASIANYVVEVVWDDLTPGYYRISEIGGDYYSETSNKIGIYEDRRRS